MPDFIVGSGQTYTTIQSAVDAVAAIGDLAGLGDHNIIVDDAHSETLTLDLSSVQAKADGKLFIKSSGTYYLTLNDIVTRTGYTTISDFEASPNTGYPSAIGVFYDNSSIENHLLRFKITNPNSINTSAFRNSAVTRNNTLVDGQISGFSGASKYAVLYAKIAERLTVTDSTTGIFGCETVTDCISVNNTTDFDSNTTVSYCASEDATASGTGSITSIDPAVEFVDAATGDYTLESGSQLIGAGSTGNNIGWDQTEVNADPVLDTPQTDVTIQEGQTGTIASDFSDANLGDTLTYSISPDINLVTGFTFNTSTGSIVYDGSQVIASAISYTITCSDGNGGTDATDTFDLTVVAASLSIDSIDDNNPTVGDQITVGHSNALGTLTTPDFTISSQNGTQAVLDIVDITSLVLTGETYPTINFDEAVTITLSDGTNTADVNLTGIQKPAGTLFAEITENNANGVYNPTPSIVAGMFGYFYDIVGNWVIDPATGLNAVDPAGGSFKYKIYNGEWGAEQTRAIAAETEAPVITLNGNASMVWVQGTPWVDPQATVTDNRDATRQISADSAPNINTPAVYTLNYNATDVAGNVATTVVRTVTVSGADVTPNPFNFVDVSNAELNTLYENTQQITGVDVGQTLTATNGTLSNDGGSTWSSSVQFVSGQTYVKASLTTTGDNSTANTVTVTVNGIQSTFTVTTAAAAVPTYGAARLTDTNWVVYV